ncbi:sensor histidine kinase [Aquitalea aquatica]|uniref:histidine kinase n=1 Tax=Aquitalea aquatica TaxID=3044273 RepID=A0A838XWT2_9NEIS|nr:ATP-binding protein [Aquitalea magnusonii]MBA4707610.1 PAS domain S-box protein [Aquitalea magnusonii]
MPTSLSRLTSLLLGALLTIILLCAEYALLLDNDRVREQEKLQHWGELGTELLATRLQEMLDRTDLLAQSLIRQRHSTGTPPNLGELAPTVLKEESRFGGIGIVRRIEPNQRTEFEAAIANSIRMLKDRHLVTSPQQPMYYPVESYLPDDGNALPQGMDLGSLDNARRKMDQARNRNQPMLMFNTLIPGSPPRLDIMANLNDDGHLLLVNLRSDLLLQSSQSNPDQPNPLQHVRLVAWNQDAPERPSLDSHPLQALPSGNPLLTTRRNIGGYDLLFGAYPLEDNQPALSAQGYGILATSALVMFLLLILQQRQISNNQGLRSLLRRQHHQLELNNRTLREQINDRASSEQALAESEARQRAILQASSDAIILINRSGLITHVNPAAAKLIGQSAESIEHLPVGSLLTELYSLSPSISFESIAAAREGRTFEAHLLRSDNSQMPVELSLSRVEAPDDSFYVAVCRDISLRKEQEAALIRLKNSLAEQVEVQSRQLAALLEASPMAMAYIVDRHLRRVNGAFLDLFEREEDEVIGQTTLPYFESQEQWERTGRALYNLLNDGKVVQSEVKLRTGRGKLIWCRMFGRAVNPSVPKLGTIWLYQDFSAQREMEDALRQAKTLAEENSRAKTEFLANMSHELRTPMHAILGFTEIGETRARQLQDDKLEQYFQRIHSSGNRLLQLLNDLLDLAKMEVGKMDYHFGHFDLAHCLREACDEMTPLASNHNIKLYLYCTPEKLTADIDPFRLGQVIRNLLSNAIKFSPAGEVIRVTARLQLNSQQQEEILICVEDSGPGIPVDEVETIFDKFIQSSSTKTGAGGTGLGLAICREILQAHHGIIFAENLSPRGAAFTAVLPRRHDASAAGEGSNHVTSTFTR